MPQICQQIDASLTVSYQIYFLFCMCYGIQILQVLNFLGYVHTYVGTYIITTILRSQILKSFICKEGRQLQVIAYVCTYVYKQVNNTILLQF